MAKKKVKPKKKAAETAEESAAPERTRLFSDESIAAALKAAGGLVYTAASMLHCSAPTIYNRIKSTPALREIFRHERGLTVDESMCKLRQAVRDNQEWAITFTLKTLGKSRGFVVRKESRIGGDKNAPPVRTSSEDVLFEELPLELQIAVLEAFEKKRKEKQEQTATPPAG